jgi:hypothetical protein
MSTPEELLERKSSGSGLEIREYGRRDPLLRRQAAVTVGIVRSRTQAMEFKFKFKNTLAARGLISHPFVLLKYMQTSTSCVSGSQMMCCMISV